MVDCVPLIIVLVTLLPCLQQTHDIQIEGRKGLFSSLFIRFQSITSWLQDRVAWCRGKTSRQCQGKREKTSISSSLVLYTGHPPPHLFRAGVALKKSSCSLLVQNVDTYKEGTVVSSCSVNFLNCSTTRKIIKKDTQFQAFLKFLKTENSRSLQQNIG